MTTSVWYVFIFFFIYGLVHCVFKIALYVSAKKIPFVWSRWYLIGLSQKFITATKLMRRNHVALNCFAWCPNICCSNRYPPQTFVDLVWYALEHSDGSPYTQIFFCICQLSNWKWKLVMSVKGKIFVPS